MKARKSRRGVSTIIAVLLMIIITVAAAVIVWAFLSGYIGARTAPTTQTSMIQINAATGSNCSVQLVSVGTNPEIAAVYINGAPATIATDSGNFATTSTMGTVITVKWTGLTLQPGGVVKVVCKDGGAASLTRT